MSFFVVFTADAPTNLFGLQLTDLMSGDTGLLCKSVQSADSGFLALVPENRPENHKQITLYVRPSHVQCWMEIGSPIDLGFLRVAPPQVRG